MIQPSVKVQFTEKETGKTLTVCVEDIVSEAKLKFSEMLTDIFGEQLESSEIPRISRHAIQIFMLMMSENTLPEPKEGEVPRSDREFAALSYYISYLYMANLFRLEGITTPDDAVNHFFNETLAASNEIKAYLRDHLNERFDHRFGRNVSSSAESKPL